MQLPTDTAALLLARHEPASAGALGEGSMTISTASASRTVRMELASPATRSAGVSPERCRSTPRGAPSSAVEVASRAATRSRSQRATGRSVAVTVTVATAHASAGGQRPSRPTVVHVAHRTNLRPSQRAPPPVRRRAPAPARPARPGRSRRRARSRSTCRLDHLGEAAVASPAPTKDAPHHEHVQDHHHQREHHVAAPSGSNSVATARSSQ